MRACVVHGRNDLRIEEVPAAVARQDEVLVAIALGGICGSDLHYYHDGAVGDFRLREPLVLGHEVAGRVAGVGDSVTGLPLGTPVAVHPATPCGTCDQCRQGRRNTCHKSRYLGSAAYTPHVQGGFAQQIVVPADQIRVLPPQVPMELAVLAEPLSVAVHAVHRAGDVWDKRVLVTGAGPIGCLVAAVLRNAGAADVVVSDLHEQALKIAGKVGATAVAFANQPDDAAWASEVDVAIEASGSPAGLSRCVQQTRRGGTVVMLGLLPPGDVALAGNVVVTRELTLKGAFRFDHEFDEALQLLAAGLDVAPVVTHTFPLTDAVAAFGLASDRTRASKVLLDLAQ